jgi:hypothetical protein
LLPKNQSPDLFGLFFIIILFLFIFLIYHLGDGPLIKNTGSVDPAEFAFLPVNRIHAFGSLFQDWRPYSRYSGKTRQIRKIGKNPEFRILYPITVHPLTPGLVFDL